MAAVLSKTLLLTNFGFEIPAGATIDGIEMQFYRGDPDGSSYDNVIQLIIGGSQTGNNKKVAGEWPASPGWSGSYGSSSDKWGTTPTAAQVNGSDFGVAIKANIEWYAKARIYAVKLTITYTEQVGGNTYDEAITLAVESGIANASQYVAYPSISFSTQVSASQSAGFIFGESLTYGVEVAETEAQSKTHSGDLTLATEADCSSARQLIAEGSVGFDVTAAAEVANNANLSSTVTFSTELEATVSPQLVFETEVSISASAGIGAVGGMVLAADLSIDVSAGCSEVGGFVYTDSVSFGCSVADTYGRNITAFPAITLGTVSGISPDRSTTLATEIIFGASVGESVSRALTIPASVSFGVEAESLSVGGFPRFNTLVLGVSCGQNLLPGFVLWNDLNLTTNVTATPSFVIKHRAGGYARRPPGPLRLCSRLLYHHPTVKNLVGWWLSIPDSRGDRWYDKSLYNVTGVLHNMTPATDWCHSGRRLCLDFDGTDDYVEVPDRPHYSFTTGTADKPFTVLAFVNMRDATNFRIVSKAIFGGAVEWQFGTSSADTLRLILYDTNTANMIYATSAALMSYENSWIMLSATYDGSHTAAGITLAVNAVTVDSTPTSVGGYLCMKNSTAPLRIGFFNSYANGKMSDVRLYNRHLTTAELRRIYHDVYTERYAALRQRGRIKRSTSVRDESGPIVIDESIIVGVKAGLLAIWGSVLTESLVFAVNTSMELGTKRFLNAAVSFACTASQSIAKQADLVGELHAGVVASYTSKATGIIRDAITFAATAGVSTSATAELAASITLSVKAALQRQVSAFLQAIATFGVVPSVRATLGNVYVESLLLAVRSSLTTNLPLKPEVIKLVEEALSSPTFIQEVLRAAGVAQESLSSPTFTQEALSGSKLTQEVLSQPSLVNESLTS